MTYLIFFWICWCILHSLLITGRINAWLRQKGGLPNGAYRLAYSLFAVLTLITLVLYQHSLPSQVLFSWFGWWRIPQALLLLYALVMLYGGYKVYDLGYLMGFSQWRNYRHGLKTPNLPFFCQGALRYVRHPWYSGGLPILWAVGSVTDTTLPARIVLSLYLIIGTLLEERKLIRELGAPYRRYRERVPMLIPWRGRVRM
jgi:protein-S-isoprenylcysteine O-methyltransferase Ste14